MKKKTQAFQNFDWLHLGSMCFVCFQGEGKSCWDFFSAARTCAPSASSGWRRRLALMLRGSSFRCSSSARWSGSWLLIGIRVVERRSSRKMQEEKKVLTKFPLPWHVVKADFHSHCETIWGFSYYFFFFFFALLIFKQNKAKNIIFFFCLWIKHPSFKVKKLFLLSDGPIWRSLSNDHR